LSDLVRRRAQFIRIRQLSREGFIDVWVLPETTAI